MKNIEPIGKIPTLLIQYYLQSRKTAFLNLTDMLSRCVADEGNFLYLQPERLIVMTDDRNLFKLNFSRFNTTVAEGDEICICNSFSGALAVLKPSEYSFLQSAVSGERKATDNQQQDLLDRCLIDNFIIREGSDEIGILKKRIEDSKENTSSLTVTVVPTLSCNFACPYCFEGVDKHSALMPESIQDRFMEWLEVHSDGLKNLSVIWFGGEPTMGIEVVKSLTAKLSEFCSRKKVAYHASMITNGFLLESLRFAF